MNNFENDDKKIKLLKRTTMLLEKTKKNQNIYKEERKLLLKLTTDKTIDYEVWEKILDAIEILIKRQEGE